MSNDKEFKKGDRVYWEGIPGVVVTDNVEMPDYYDDYILGVDFDPQTNYNLTQKISDQFHNLGGTLPKKTGYWCYASKLKHRNGKESIHE